MVPLPPPLVVVPLPPLPFVLDPEPEPLVPPPLGAAPPEEPDDPVVVPLPPPLVPPEESVLPLVEEPSPELLLPLVSLPPPVAGVGAVLVVAVGRSSIEPAWSPEPEPPLWT